MASTSDVWREMAGPDEEEVARNGLGHRGTEHEADDEQQRPEVAGGTDGRDAGVDALLDEVRDGQAGGVLDDDDDHEPPEGAAPRTQHLRQEPAGAAGQAGAGLCRQVALDVVRSDSAPLLGGGAHACTPWVVGVSDAGPERSVTSAGSTGSAASRSR